MSLVPVRLLHVSLALDGASRPVGRLAWVDRRVYFEFDPALLAAPLPLSPMHLPVRPGVHEDTKRTFDGLFGLFDDSLPDGWGRLLLDREMDRLGIGRHNLTPLDRLAFVGANGPGALVYEPAWAPEPPSVIELATLVAESAAVLDGDESSVFPALLALGGSSGGARPKALLAWNPDTGALSVGRAAPPPGTLPLIVKFPMRHDPADIGAIELAYAAMARAAGIEVSPTWLLGATKDHPGFFATQRYDRDPRRHVHSLAGLLHADHRVPSMDYEGLLRAVRWLTRDQRAVDQMFRRMAFNVLAHNRDDHSRNFAVRMSPRGTWALAPAYDLTFSAGPGGEHWMTVAGEGRDPTAEHMLTLAKKVGVSPKVATAILDDVREAVSGWAGFASASGVGASSLRRVSEALNRAR